MKSLLEMTTTPFASHCFNQAMESDRRGSSLPRHRTIRGGESRQGAKENDVPSPATIAAGDAVPSDEVNARAKAEFRLGQSTWPRRAPQKRRRIISATKTPRASRSTESLRTKNTNMIDSIKIKASLPVIRGREEELLRNESALWTNRSEQTFHSHSETWHKKTRAHDKNSGFTAYTKDGTLINAKASLPRLLYGSNGKLIKTPEELEIARHAFLAKVRVLNPNANMDDLKIDRLDLVFNLPCDPREVLALHRLLKHLMINLETELYFNTPPEKRWGKPPHRMSELNTVRLHGTRTTIQLYDKVREILGGKSGDWPEHSLCTRVEIQLRGAKHIAKQLGYRDRDYIRFDELDFRTCYLAFRRILMEFDGNGGVPSFKPDLVSTLAILERHPETWDLLGGMSPLDWWRHTTSPSWKRFREVRKNVGKMTLELEQFRWADVLPPDRLPDLVEVGEDGSENVVPSPWTFRIMSGFPGPVPLG